MGTPDAMIEQVITISVIVSSILLLSYWSRYMLRLILSGIRKVQRPRPGGGKALDGLKELLDLDNAALNRVMNRPNRLLKRRGGR